MKEIDLDKVPFAAVVEPVPEGTECCLATASAAEPLLRAAELQLPMRTTVA